MQSTAEGVNKSKAKLLRAIMEVVGSSPAIATKSAILEMYSLWRKPTQIYFIKKNVIKFPIAHKRMHTYIGTILACRSAHQVNRGNRLLGLGLKSWMKY